MGEETGTTELVVVEEVELLDVRSGEVLPATVENAHHVLEAARDMKDTCQRVIRATTDWLVEESGRLGTKTFATPGGGKVALSGGPTTKIDGQLLEQLLGEAGCPEERIRDCVTRVETIDYKVNGSVVRQLAASNPDYKAAIDLASHTEEKSWSASLK